MRTSAASDAALIDAVPAAAAGRFAADWQALAGEAPTPDRPIGVAVSGGADSVALLLLARATHPGAVIAATVDHGLRPEAQAEALFVGRICARLGVPHTILAPVPDMLAAGNLQDRARAMRYRRLAGWAEAAGAPWVAVAHQQDDLAETLLLRARRGAGLGGLAAMAPIRPMLAGSATLLLRPLLGWSRAELAGLVARAGIEAVADPSNRHPRFDRSRMRALLGATPELPPARLAAAAEHLREAEAALAWVAAHEWQARAEQADGALLLDAAGLPAELRRRLVVRALESVGAARPLRGPGVDRLIAALAADKPATLAGVLARPGARWRFAPAPPRRSV